MKSILQNFFHVIRMFKSSSVINILGLSVALIVFFIVLIQAHYDFTYDKGYQYTEEISQLCYYKGKDKTTYVNVSFQFPILFQDRLPEIEAYCLTNYPAEQSFVVEDNSPTPAVHQAFYASVTSGFNGLFAPEILQGDTTAIFSTPGKAMISEKTARRMFGDEDPIGKNISFLLFDGTLTVQAVYKDFPKNSSLANGIYTQLQRDIDENWNYKAFFRIKPENLNSIKTKINTAEVVGEDAVRYNEENPENKVEFRLFSMNDMFLNIGGKGGAKRMNTTLSLLAIGILTLVIAFVNFVNLSLAMAPSRVRDINIRKILGANKTSLRLTIAMESVFFTLLSLLIAFLGIYFIKGTTLAQQMFTSELSLWTYRDLLTVASLAILLLAFLIGLYTMRYSTSFNESEALKGSFALGVKGVKLRNVLIVFQFSTAIVLICISLSIKQQNDYMLHYDWGMPKENVIYCPLSELRDKSELFGEELLRDPRVKDYCITSVLPGRVGMSWGRGFEGKQVNLFAWSVDERFIDFFDINIISGHKPEHMDSLVSRIVVNEAFLKKYDFDERIVGKDLYAFGPGRIDAIAKDVNFHSLHEPIMPMAFVLLTQWQNFNYILVKLSGEDMPGALGFVEQVWNKFSDHPFEVRFLDEAMDKLYQNENNMAKMIGIFGFIIVIIAVMGIYGLIVFNARYKRKEIAIRKVNGSSIKEIILMLNKTILIQLAIAFVIAIPVAYFIIGRWLENFAYKITPHWWIFPLGAVIVLFITMITVSVQSYKAASANPTKALSSSQ